MSVVPTRQVVVLSVANISVLCAKYGDGVADVAIQAIRSCAVECGAQPDHMRRMRQNTVLARLDHLSGEEFLARVRLIGERTATLTLPEAGGSALLVQVAAMSERAQRAFVDDAAMAMLAYLGHAGRRVGFLTGEEADGWHQSESHDVEFITYDQLKGIDPRTGMLTFYRFARLLQEVLDDEVLRERCSVLYFDIADFKSYNRAFGKEKGDELLRFVADQLWAAFPGDLVCHVAIDRFVVATSDENARERIDAMHDAVRARSQVFPPELKCGIFVPTRGSLDADVAMDCAKLACERVKNTYDVAYDCFDDELEQRMFASRYVAHQVDRAVSEGWIRVFYQPVVDAKTGELCGYEALARWDDPEQGLLSPAIFVPVLEEARIIHKVDLCAVRQVCEQLAAWREQGAAPVSVSINLSRADFLACDIVSEVLGLCEAYEIEPRLLDVEVTESALSEDHEYIIQQMDRFRAAGHQVWMDDFGSGYSTLNLLKDFEFDVLKVDMEFQHAIETNLRAQQIVSAVIKLAKRLGLRTLVEGVETEWQRDFVRAAGCDLMQGYLFGRPQPMDS